MNEKRINEYVPFSSKAGLFIGSEASIVLYIVVSAYLMYYYSNVVGLNIGIVGVIIMISKVFDGISDIIFGRIIDKTKSKWGACRAWLLWDAVPLAVAFVLLFTIPGAEGISPYVYVFFSYNLFVSVCYTIQQAANMALPTFMSRDKNVIGVLFTCIYLGISVFAFLSSTFTMTWVELLGGGKPAWLKLACILAALSIITQLIMVFTTKETVNLQELTHDKKTSLGETLKCIITNKYWIMATIIVSVGTCIQVSTMSTATYFAQYILNNVGLTGVIIAGFSLPPICAYLVVGPLLKKYSRRGIALTLVVIGLVGQTLVFFSGTSLPLIVIGMALKGIAYAPLILLSSAMLSDSIEYGHWRTGVRAQAVLMSAKGIGEKIATGLVSGFIGWFMAYRGFNGMTEVQTASALGSISGLVRVMPFIFFIIIGLVASRYTLDKDLPRIMNDLKENKFAKQGGQKNE